MTGEETKAVVGALERLTEALLDRNANNAKLDKLVEGLATQSATLDGFKDMVEAQLPLLFDLNRKLDARVGTVEANYVPRDACNRNTDKQTETLDQFRARNQAEHDEFRGQIRGLSLNMAKVGGAIAVGTAVLNWIVSNWGIIRGAAATGGHP